ncbi:MAG: hypothetical protein HY451_00100 [Parcubacteria group bacterium]|nr:hypothetical protein [Parcubacteria group bacterium]
MFRHYKKYTKTRVYLQFLVKGAAIKENKTREATPISEPEGALRNGQNLMNNLADDKSMAEVP